MPCDRLIIRANTHDSGKRKFARTSLSQNNTKSVIPRLSNTSCRSRCIKRTLTSAFSPVDARHHTRYAVCGTCAKLAHASDSIRLQLLIRLTGTCVEWLKWLKREPRVLFGSVPRIDPRYERRIRAEPYEKFVFVIHAEITIDSFFSAGDSPNLYIYLNWHGRWSKLLYIFGEASTNIGY